MRPRLITIPLSHYCERGRWALDHAGIDYDEDQHLQAFAHKVVRREGGKKTVPVLVADGEKLFDSGDILRWASSRAKAPLYPNENSEVEALDAELGGRYGVETRRLAYEYFFRCVHACLPYNSGAAPSLQVWLLELGRPFIQPKMEQYLGLNPPKLQQARDHVRKTLDEVAERLEDGRPYLCGDRFTAADLTFAAMTAVVVLPENYAVPLPSLEALDDEAQSFVGELREHPAGKYALSLYESRPRVRGRLARQLRMESRVWKAA